MSEGFIISKPHTLIDVNRVAKVVMQLSNQSDLEGSVHDPSGMLRKHPDRVILSIPPQELPKERISFSDLISVPVSHRLAGEEAILGKGTYGVVKLMMDKRTKQRYAVKYLDQRIVKTTGMESQVQLEIMAQTLVQHPNVVKCWNVVGDRDYIYLILEYCQNGDLFKKLRMAPGRRLREKEVFRYFLQLVSGLAHIHNLGLCHRDLKLENLLLDANNNLKIADFGWATRINGHRKNFNFCGTLDYLSPEMIRGQGHDWRIDIWAVGVLLYELLMGKPPFLSTRHYDLLDRILNVKIHDNAEASYSSLRTRKRWMKPDALEAVRSFLQPVPNLRICMEDIFALQWVQRMISEQYTDYLQSCPLTHTSNINKIDHSTAIQSISDVVDDMKDKESMNDKESMKSTVTKIRVVKPVRLRLRSDESIAFKKARDMFSDEIMIPGPGPRSHEELLTTRSPDLLEARDETKTMFFRPRHLRKGTNIGAEKALGIPMQDDKNMVSHRRIGSVSLANIGRIHGQVSIGVVSKRILSCN